jgi:membrane associated rhomboid family serine protease
MALPTPPPAPTCPRHPQREAWRACTRCGRTWCNDCLIPAAIGSHCVECVKAAQPPVKERMRRTMAVQSFPVTKALLITNLIVFVLVVALDSSAMNGGISGIDSPYYDLALARFFIDKGEMWRLITSGFIHFGIMHIAFNSLALWNLGQMMEPLLGSKRFAMLYFASLLAGSAGVLIIDQGGLTGGASGAVFGLFGAAAVALRHRGINPFQTSIGTMLLINLVLTFTFRNISIGGHLGGLVGGVICGLVLGAPKWKRVSNHIAWGVPVIVMLVSVAISVVVSRL